MLTTTEGAASGTNLAGGHVRQERAEPLSNLGGLPAYPAFGARERFRLWGTAVVFILASAWALGQLLPKSTGIARAQQIAWKLPYLRHLTFKKPVHFVEETPEQAAIDMRDELREDTTDDELKISSVSGAMLGIYPSGLDLENEYGKMIKTNIAGFYDVHRERMVLIGRKGTTSHWFALGQHPSYLTDMIVAHELTHALQDQYFDLRSLEKLKHDDDRELALRAVVEGDATITGLSFTFAGLSRDQARAAYSQITADSSGARHHNDLTEATKEEQNFEYGAGSRFMGEALRRGGWELVDKVFRNPPQSTHEILNPAAYFEHPAPRYRISIQGQEKFLAGWKEVDNNTLGQLMLWVALKRNLGDPSRWAKTANAWKGDRFLVLRRGENLTVIGFVSFSGADFAREVSWAYEGVLDKIHGIKIPHRIELRGDTMLILVGESASQSREMSNRLWAESQFSHGAMPVVGN